MRLLLDTHVLLWALLRTERLTGEFQALLQHSDNDAFFSSASIWEIAIKTGLGREDFRVDPMHLAQEARRVGFLELPVRADAAARVLELPYHHRDPFDRLLVAQAITEDMQLYTADRRLLLYSNLVVPIG